MRLAEAFLSARTGEVRAAVMEKGRLAEMHVERWTDGFPAGSVVGGRLRPGRMAIACGQPIRLADVPPSLSEGMLAAVKVTRAAVPERHRRKPAEGRVLGPAPAEGLLAPVPPLAERLAARGMLVREAWPDEVAEAWQDAWTEAELGEIRIPRGRLSLVPTPAGVAVDVDGEGPPHPLSVGAVEILAGVIRRFGIGGLVLLDLPALGRAERQDVAARLDVALGRLRFERTAINGFGLLQLVLPRTGPSVLERAWFARGESLALDLVDAAVRDPRPGALRIVAPPQAAAVLSAHPDLVASAARAAGRPIDVLAMAPILGGHVEEA